jgi:hypothetical protein
MASVLQFLAVSMMLVTLQAMSVPSDHKTLPADIMALVGTGEAAYQQGTCGNSSFRLKMRATVARF